MLEVVAASTASRPCRGAAFGGIAVVAAGPGGGGGGALLSHAIEHSVAMLRRIANEVLLMGSR